MSAEQGAGQAHTPQRGKREMQLKTAEKSNSIEFPSLNGAKIVNQ